MGNSLHIEWDKEVDVIVLGTGGAALSAAIAAADNGAKVLMWTFNSFLFNKFASFWIIEKSN